MFNRDFDTVCKYANLKYRVRQDKSHSKDMSNKFFYNHWTGDYIMVLYEGEKRLLRGHKTPDVCWICINEFGGISSVPARHLRAMREMKGFSFVNGVWDEMISLLEWYYNKES